MNSDTRDENLDNLDNIDVENVNDGDYEGDGEHLENKYDPKYIERMKKESIRNRRRAKESEELMRKSVEAEKNLKDRLDKVEDSLKKSEENMKLSEKRVINAELRALATEFGLKKMDYIKLGQLENVKIDENGEVVGAREMFIDLKKSDPELFKGMTTTNVDFSNTTRSANENNNDVMSLSDEEYKKKEQDFFKKTRWGFREKNKPA